MSNFLVRIIGYVATIIHGDTAVFDRWWWLRRHLGKGPLRTLDAGCGSGALTLYAAKVGNDAVGISFDDRNNTVGTERARLLGISRARFIMGDLRKLDTLAPSLGTFDQVICFETIEHILDDKKLLRDIARLMNIGGKLLLTAPYKHYRRLPGDMISEIEDGGHVRWGYTHGEMKRLLNKTGFRVVRAEYVTGVISQFLIRAGRVMARAMPHRIAWLLIFPFRIFVIFDTLFTKLLRYPHLSIAVVAVRQ